MVTTALWLEGGDPARLARWEGLRLASLGLMLLFPRADLGTGLLVAVAVYVAGCLLFLLSLRRGLRLYGAEPQA
jgi:ABC-type enterochelin transport system permease subunit